MPSSCPTIPPFLHKHGGLVISHRPVHAVGRRAELMGAGAVQIWPGTPVAEALDRRRRACAGVRLRDQGVDREGQPDAGFMPGMDIHAALTVVGDGPVGAVGRQLDEQFGLPAGHHQREWAVGMKMVVDLPRRLRPGARHGVPHLRLSRAGDLRLPLRASRTAWPRWAFSCRRGSAAPCARPTATCSISCCIRICGVICEGGKLRSWGAKSLQESGRRGEPFLAGNGYARIGEGSGSTNVLTGSGVDEAWTTGSQLAEAVLELLRRGQAVHQGKPGADLRGAAPRKLGGAGRPHRRKGARRLPPRRGHGPDRHGAGGLHQGQALDRRRAATAAGAWRSTTAARFPPAELEQIVARLPQPRRRPATTP